MRKCKTSEQVQTCYAEEVARQSNTYEQWIAKWESPSQLEKDLKKEPHEKVVVIPYSSCKGNFSFVDKTCDIYVFYDDRGVLAETAYAYLEKAFTEGYQVVYADEDVKAEQRGDFWFKPDWSPDTFASYFYFGSIFACKREVLEHYDWNWKQSENPIANLYDLFLQILPNMSVKAIGHVDRILYHRNEKIEVDNLSYENLFGKRDARLVSTPKVSIIIPSKDNPQILEVCLQSLKAHTNYTNYEILVVDNGSSEANQKKITQIPVEIRYLYEVMPFNFSKMCNCGVKQAQGEYILLLNDDMEIIQDNWLEQMLEKAMLPHAGAVGCKLYFPNSDLIQHMGVTNLEVGPAHKLSRCSDSECYYYGINRGVHNFLAVTAACLLVRKSKYVEVGGMCEEIEVAYNDVDFCFSLYEAGYYNIQRNDVILYHHESLSRGDDLLSDIAYERLMQEKDRLYQRHPALYHRDPFYSRHLAQDSIEFTSGYTYAFQKRENYAKVKKRFGRLCREGFAVGTFLYTLEWFAPERKLEKQEAEHYRIEGWSVVLGEDNACYKTTLYLKNPNQKGWYYQIEPMVRYRDDVQQVFLNEKQVTLSGFCIRFPVGLLPEGKYDILILKQNLLTGEKRIHPLQETLERKS